MFDGDVYMKKNRIILLLSILLFVSVIVNAVLLIKVNYHTNSSISDNDNKNDLVGIYYNESVGKIEFKEKSIFVDQFNTEYTYEVDGDDLIFIYYVDLHTDDEKSCTAVDSNGDIVKVDSCKMRQSKNGKIVNDGIIYDNKLFTKVK